MGRVKEGNASTAAILHSPVSAANRHSRQALVSRSDGACDSACDSARQCRRHACSVAGESAPAENEPVPQPIAQLHPQQPALPRSSVQCAAAVSLQRLLLVSQLICYVCCSLALFRRRIPPVRRSPPRSTHPEWPRRYLRLILSQQRAILIRSSSCLRAKACWTATTMHATER